jgi:hypothetical protein
MREQVSDAGYAIGYTLIALFCVVVFIGGLYLLAPAWLGLERHAIVQSESYVQSRQQELTRLQTKHDQLQGQINQARQAGNDQGAHDLETEQRGVDTQIRQIRSTMPNGTIPPEVTVR